MPETKEDIAMIFSADRFFSLIKKLVFFGLHVDCTNMFPHPLSKEEEARLFEEMSNGNDEARKKLIEHNLRLVAHIIKKYYTAQYEQDELISIGTIGLIKAVSTFDFQKGTRFATYGSRCIENEILMYFRSQKKSASDMHMEQPIDVDKDGNALTLIDVITDEKSFIDDIELSVFSEQLYLELKKCLDKRELEIIILRYGLYGGTALTQREVAKALNISRSYVSRLEKKALDKLKKNFVK